MGVEAAPAVDVAETALPWWERRWFLALVVLATMIPLLYPPIPPLVDLLGHLGHYRVELDGGRSPWLQRYYGFRWAPIGNLGVDLLLIPLGPLLGLEPAVKLIVLLIPPLTAAGMIWVAREVHGRVPPTVMFALPFIYGFPFLFGFLNYALSVALAFIAFGLWLRLGRLGLIRFRSWLFAPVSLILFFCHIYGWGLLGLMCFSSEVIRLLDKEGSLLRSFVRAVLLTMPLALPLAVIVVWPAETRDGARIVWFAWQMKLRWIYAALRDRWGAFDMASLAFAVLVILVALLDRRFVISRRLGIGAAILCAAFLFMPPILFGSAYADMRLVPYVLALMLLSLHVRDVKDVRIGRLLALLGLLFFSVRIAANTASLAIASVDQQARLKAVDLIPRGGRVATFYGLPHPEPWALPRDSHLGALVVARREGFSNDQFINAGHNLQALRYHEAGAFGFSPSENVRQGRPEPGGYLTIDEALTELPRDKFDYIWLIDVLPTDRQLLAGLTAVWRGAGAVLYRIDADGRKRNGNRSTYSGKQSPNGPIGTIG